MLFTADMLLVFISAFIIAMYVPLISEVIPAIFVPNADNAFASSSNRFSVVKIFVSLIFALTILYVYKYLMYEMFHFEVSPWKKTCLFSHPHRCQGCCMPGFNGRPINFEYTGDAERMNMQTEGCYGPCNQSFLKNNPDSYSSLGDTYGNRQVSEPYCGPATPYVTEGYCGSCSGGVTEGYCGSCSGGVTEGYCGSCSG